MGYVASEQVKRAAIALKTYHTSSKDGLALDDDAAVYLGYHREEIPIHAVNRPKCFKVPHSVYPAAAKVCLFVKDVKEDDKQTREFYNQLKFNIDKVMVYNKVKKQYHGYDSLRVLAAKYDIFLVDKRLALTAYHILGRQFAKKAHKPIPITIEGRTPKQITERIERIKHSAVYVPANGATCSIKIGTIGFTPKQIKENVKKAVKVIQKKESWSKVVNMYIKTPTSPSLTIYQVIPTLNANSESEGEKKGEEGEKKGEEGEKKGEDASNGKATPKKGDATPKKGGDTPKKGGGSWKKGGDTPKKETPEKEKVDHTAKKAKPTPKKGETTPKKGETTPKKVEDTPKEVEATPKEVEATPKKAEATPKKVEATPKKAEATPKKVEATPKKAEATPKKADATPKKVEATSKKGEATPKKAEATPKVHSTPAASTPKPATTESSKKRKQSDSTNSKPTPEKVSTPKSNKKIKPSSTPKAK